MCVRKERFKFSLVLKEYSLEIITANKMQEKFTPNYFILAKSPRLLRLRVYASFIISIFLLEIELYLQKFVS